MSSAVFEKEVARFFRDHDGWSVGIAGDDVRHDGRIHNAQVIDPMHLQPGINHGHRIIAHLAGADGVIDRLRDRARGVQQFSIARCRVSWHLLLDDERGHLPGLRQFSRDTHRTDDRVLVESMVYWDRVETEWPLRHQLPIGVHVPLHCTATGKLYLSTLSKKQRRFLLSVAALDRHTPKTIMDIDALDEALAEISASGLSTDNEEFIEGMVAIAVPVTDKLGRFVAGLAIHAPVVRMSLEEAISHADVLRAAAQELGSDITGTQW